MENREGKGVPQSASLSANNDNELSESPMSEQYDRDKGLDDHAEEGRGKVDNVAKDHEENSATSLSFVALQEPESSDGKQLVVKRKRGRPRKSDDVNGNVVLTASLVETGSQTNPSLANPVKRSRGRPPGTGRLQLLASCGGIVAESAGGSFTTHVICVNPGDDVVKTIKHFSWGPRAVVILSAEGSVSNISIRAAGGVLQFKGNFEVTNLNGSFVYGGTGVSNNKVGSLSITFAHPNGKLYGGQVEGMMIAATPIRIIAGSFKQSICNELRRKYPTESSSALKVHECLDESDPQAKMREGEDNCVAPRSPVLSGTLEGGVISETQHLEPPSLQNAGQEKSMSLPPVLQQSTPTENVVENSEI